MSKPESDPDETRRRVVDRLREARIAERFSQDEFASEIGLNRVTLANYEQGSNRLPLAVGLAVCQRLDLNPRWLMTGKEPKRPFVPLEELGLTEDSVKVPKRVMDFVQGYEKFLEAPLEKWLAENPPEKILLQMLRSGPEVLARRLSIEELEQSLMNATASVITGRDHDKPSNLGLVIIFARELKKRLELKYPRAS